MTATLSPDCLEYQLSLCTSVDWPCVSSRSSLAPPLCCRHAAAQTVQAQANESQAIRRTLLAGRWQCASLLACLHVFQLAVPLGAPAAATAAV